MSDHDRTSDRTERPTDADARPTDRPSVMTVAEASVALGIGKDAVWSRIKRGTLPKVEGMSGPGGEVYVDLAGAASGGRRKRAPMVPTDRTGRPTVEGATEPNERPTGTATAIDGRDVRLAGLEAERDALLDARAYLKDAMELERAQHRDAVAGLRADHARAVETLRAEMQAMREGHRRDIEALTAAIGEQAAMLRAVQAQAVPPQMVDVLPPGGMGDGHGSPGPATRGWMAKLKFWEG